MERPEAGGAQATASAPRADAESLALGRYSLGRRLGAGGYGVVWQAWDERLRREVAVKIVPAEDGGARAPREAQAAARLNHPGIVALYELAADAEQAYLVSELVPGRNLAELERARALSDRDVARIGAELCDALEHAHERGVVHRDVKPQNVMVVAEPAAGSGFAKLADFGVAHLAGAERLTGTGDVVGTLAYMAPEQAEGRAVTPTCDVYSLALTLYEAWTGTNPVRAHSLAATARRLGGKVPPLARRRRDLPLELCQVVDAALSRDPRRRPSPGDLGALLRDHVPELSDEGGLVKPETLERVGISPSAPGLPRLGGLPGRLAAAAGGGALVLAALTQLGPEPAPYASVAAAGATVATALLPRVGWIGAALGVCAWLVGTGRAGTALLLVAVLAPTPLLMPRAGVLWSLPVAAPLLAAAGLGPAFVGLAALAPGVLRRAGLAAMGFLWLAGAEVLSGDPLLFGQPDGALSRIGWEGSPAGAATDAIAPLLLSPALAPAAVWAVFAAVLPLLLRGRLLVVDLIAAVVWAAALVAAHAALAEVVTQTTVLDAPRGAVLGSLVGAVGAALALFLARPAEARLGPEGAQPATAS